MKDLFSKMLEKNEQLKLGIKTLDDSLRIEKSNYVVIGARTGIGKSAFALNIADNFIKQNKKVAFFSFEMSEKDLFKRYLQKTTNIPNYLINSGEVANLNGKLASEYFSSYYNFSKINTFEDYSNITLETVINQIRLLNKKGVKIFFIDYLQQIRGNNSRSRYEEIGEISRAFRILTLELDITIFSLVQLNRGSEARNTNEVFSSDIRESGNIEQDATAILLLYFEDEEEDDISRQINVKVSKNRNGNMFTEQLTFFKQKQVFL